MFERKMRLMKQKCKIIGYNKYIHWRDKTKTRSSKDIQKIFILFLNNKFITIDIRACLGEKSFKIFFFYLFIIKTNS